MWVVLLVLGFCDHTQIASTQSSSPLTSLHLWMSLSVGRNPEETMSGSKSLCKSCPRTSGGNGVTKKQSHLPKVMAKRCSLFPSFQRLLITTRSGSLLLYSFLLRPVTDCKGGRWLELLRIWLSLPLLPVSLSQAAQAFECFFNSPSHPAA